MDTRVVEIDDGTVCVGIQDFNSYSYTFYVKSTHINVDHELTKSDLMRWWDTSIKLKSRPCMDYNPTPWRQTETGVVCDKSRSKHLTNPIEPKLQCDVDGYVEEDDQFVCSELDAVVNNDLSISEISSYTIADRVISKGLLTLNGAELKKFINKLSKSNAPLVGSILSERLPRLNETIANSKSDDEREIAIETKGILLRFAIVVMSDGAACIPKELITKSDIAALPEKFRRKWKSIN